jgi:hypothetical protein
MVAWSGYNTGLHYASLLLRLRRWILMDICWIWVTHVHGYEESMVFPARHILGTYHQCLKNWTVSETIHCHLLQLICCFSHSSTLRMEAICSWKPPVISELGGVMAQKTVFVMMVTAALEISSFWQSFLQSLYSQRMVPEANWVVERSWDLNKSLIRQEAGQTVSYRYSNKSLLDVFLCVSGRLQGGHAFTQFILSIVETLVAYVVYVPSFLNRDNDCPVWEYRLD